MTGFIRQWCNPYGVETGGAKNMGGLGTDPVKYQWACKEPAIARFRMECAHGHRGQVMPLCHLHANEFSKKDITFCPRCNQDPKTAHNCRLQLKEIS